MAKVLQPGGRAFTAFARPQGHPDLGLAGPVIEVHERVRHGLATVKVLTRAEAEQLHAEIGEALRAFDLAKALACEVAIEVGCSERPQAYIGPYPIRGKTLADVEAG